MPVKAYFHGHGQEVMTAMQKRYGSKRGQRVFFATAAKRKQRPQDSTRNALRRRLKKKRHAHG